MAGCGSECMSAQSTLHTPVARPPCSVSLGEEDISRACLAGGLKALYDTADLTYAACLNDDARSLYTAISVQTARHIKSISQTIF